MESLGSLSVGDVCWQIAEVAEVTLQKEGKESDQDKFFLNVSDEHGMITKKLIVPRHIFEKQFFAYPQQPNYFFRKVRIEDIDGSAISFIRLDYQDNPIGECQRVKEDIFMSTYFLPQHQMGDM